MSDESQLQFIDVLALGGLTEEQKATLASKGIVLVETFLSMTRVNPAAMAALLSCSVDELSCLCVEAGKLMRHEDDLDVPQIPPFGLVPPSERTALPHEDKSRKGQSPCLD
jgi:hypothetical protein